MKSPEAGQEREISQEEFETTLLENIDQTQGDGLNHSNIYYVFTREEQFQTMPQRELELRVDEVVLKLQSEGKIQATYLGTADAAYRGFVWKRK